ncbi:MAG: tyrosine-type recombinase/integrase, partial [Lachnospiraceae bacterium]|nr:tyrosine-type recombinase/integrase [Lachnospiraceae bacterium]
MTVTETFSGKDCESTSAPALHASNLDVSVMPSSVSTMQIEEIRMNELLLQKYRDNGMMMTAEAAELNSMLFSKKERLVKQVHKNKISYRKDGKHREDYCYTNVKVGGSSSKVSGSYTDVVLKLYSIYFGTGDDIDLSFSEIRADFEKWYIIGRQPSTLMADQKAYLHIKGTKLDKMPIRKITYQDIKSFFVNFSKEHAGEYAKSTYDKLRSCIYNMLEYALDEGIISNRVEKYHYTKAIIVCFAQNDPRGTWTTEEHDRLIRYLDAQEDVFSMLFEYQLLTGDRYETISALRREDIDEDRCVVHIHAHNTLAPAGSERTYSVKEGTKGNGQNGRRWMPILPFTLKVLKRAMELEPDGEFVFMFRDKAVQYNTYIARVHRLCEAAGVPYHNPHSCRSYVASKINDGNNISQMSDYFGWSDKKMALRYNRDVDRDSAEIREKLTRVASVHRRTLGRCQDRIAVLNGTQKQPKGCFCTVGMRYPLTI